MQSTERSAKTINEAVELALAELGAAKDDVTIEVLSEGRSGILGIGAEVARVRVTLKDESRPASSLRAGAVATAPGDAESPQEDLSAAGREVLEKILSSIGLEARVEARSHSAYGMPESQVSCVLDIQGTDLGILIGRRGKTLFSLQYLVNLILSKRYRSRVKVFVDVEGYRLRRQDSLRSLALRMAEQVRSSGREVTLESMPPHERRIVHLTLQSNPHVVTESVGEGDNRKVIISPKR